MTTTTTKFKRYYDPMWDSMQYAQVRQRPEPVPQQQVDANYIKYLESTTECQAVRIAQLQAAASVLLIKMRCERDCDMDAKRLAEMVRDASDNPEVLKLIREWY